MDVEYNNPSDIKKYKPRKMYFGHKFGRLTVVSYVRRCNRHIDGGRNSYWKCLCECGNVVLCNSTNLKKRTGCQKCSSAQERKKRFKKADKIEHYSYKKRMFRNYRRRAKMKNYQFELSELDFFKLIDSDCSYCGCAPLESTRVHVLDGVWYTNGIDRIDSNRGYTFDNVVPACKICNYAKNWLSAEEFLEWLHNAYHFTFKSKERQKVPDK